MAENESWPVNSDPEHAGLPGHADDDSNAHDDIGSPLVDPVAKRANKKQTAPAQAAPDRTIYSR